MILLSAQMIVLALDWVHNMHQALSMMELGCQLMVLALDRFG